MASNFLDQQAIFLDRDGVINRERADYVKSWEEFEFLPGVLQALAQLSKMGLPIVVITNQSAIGRGIVTHQEVMAIHRMMIETVIAAGGRIDGVYVCPHHPKAGCMCRKPRPGLLQRAARAFDLCLSQCYFVGDAITDMLAAHAAGCQPVLVSSGRQGPELPGLVEVHPDVPLLPDLARVAEMLLSVKQVFSESIQRDRSDARVFQWS